MELRFVPPPPPAPPVPPVFSSRVPPSTTGSGTKKRSEPNADPPAIVPAGQPPGVFAEKPATVNPAPPAEPPMQAPVPAEPPVATVIGLVGIGLPGPPPGGLISKRGRVGGYPPGAPSPALVRLAIPPPPPEPPPGPPAPPTPGISRARSGSPPSWPETSIEPAISTVPVERRTSGSVPSPKRAYPTGKSSELNSKRPPPLMLVKTTAPAEFRIVPFEVSMV